MRRTASRRLLGPLALALMLALAVTAAPAAAKGPVQNYPFRCTAQAGKGPPSPHVRAFCAKSGAGERLNPVGSSPSPATGAGGGDGAGLVAGGVIAFTLILVGGMVYTLRRGGSGGPRPAPLS